MKKIDKKLIIIIGVCIAIVIAIAFALFKVIGSGVKANQNKEPSLLLYTHQVIDIENLDTSLYVSSMSKIKDFKIASKYKVGKEAYTFDANVDMYLDGKMAKPIYIREKNTNLNVVQLKYQLTHNEETPEVMQVEEMMRDFQMECKSNMGLMDLEKEPNEVSISEEKSSYSESIYENKELYSARYVVEDEHFTDEEYKEMGMDKSEFTKTYDINFYMDGQDTLVCEFVRIL
ncbi:MAG: hypothetical protein IKF17_03995 [Clostridia bacterium]|nr:hypothetical protein [Clostridia bacterium]